MVARVTTVAFNGIDACEVDVQVRITPGLTSFTIVGLGDKAIAESRERLRAALGHIGLTLPANRITVNLAPADLPKEGSHYDVPIALGIMVAMKVLPQSAVKDFVAFGELALDGSLLPAGGTLPAAIAAYRQGRGLICPASCGPEAAWADSRMEIVAAEHLRALMNHLRGDQILPRPEVPEYEEVEIVEDLKEVKGQELAKRVLEIAAAGSHNLLMVGPPGAGKSMLARRLRSILPPLTAEEILEVSMIRSVSGLLDGGKLSRLRPFRSPHHSMSMAALVGGGQKGRPGEVSLAHMGVLFLDELPEFSARVLDSLRQPLEAGEVSIARVQRRVTYPSRFQLIAAMNPCRCGMRGVPGHVCARRDRCATEYQARISGPLLDRIDLRVELSAALPSDLLLPSPMEGSAEVGQRVLSARERQSDRFRKRGLKGVLVNAHCPAGVLEEIAEPDDSSRALLGLAVEKMCLSARSYHRILRVARTIADLAGEERVLRMHFAEALSYRGLIGEFGRMSL